jgi:hypothetical protein
VIQRAGLKILVKNTFADLTLTPRLRSYGFSYLFLFPRASSKGETGGHSNSFPGFI